MTRIVKFTVYGTAISKGNLKARVSWRFDPTHGKRRPIALAHNSNPNLETWEDTIAAVIQQNCSGVFFERHAPVAVCLVFFMPRPKSAPKRVVLPAVAPDLDKLIRGAFDACTGPLWHDDGQVVHVASWKVFALDDRPKVEFTVMDAVDVQPPEWNARLF